jgi:hypothetical protein
MKRISISYTDDISGLSPSTDLICAIGEFKQMEAQYGCDTCLDNVIVKYNSAFALDVPVEPKTDNSWKISTTNITIGIEYPMSLEVDGSSQDSNYYKGKNYEVYFTKDTSNTFTIRHKFYITDDTNTFIGQNGANGFSNWLQNKSIGANNNNQTSVYDTTKYFTKFISISEINAKGVENYLDYDIAYARFYENEITTTITNNWHLESNKLIINTPIHTAVLFDAIGVTPSSAKLLLINKNGSNLDNFEDAIIEDSQIAVISNTGIHYKLEADITALTIGQKNLVAVVYDYNSNIVFSGKIESPELDVIWGCYPNIIPQYRDYNNTNIGECIESTVSERIIYGFGVSRVNFNNISPFAVDCFPLGFDNYQKVARLKLSIQSTGTIVHESIAIYNLGTWTSVPVFGTGSMSINTTTPWHKFFFNMRNEWLGEYILAEFELDIIYSQTHTETVKCSSINHIINYDMAMPVPKIHSIELINPENNNVISSRIDNLLSLNSSCLDYFKVKICKLDTDEFNIIPVLRQGVNVFEYDPYSSTVMSQLTNSYFVGVPATFGGSNCAEFYLDTSNLDKNLPWILEIIIKKV